MKKAVTVTVKNCECNTCGTKWMAIHSINTIKCKCGSVDIDKKTDIIDLIKENGKFKIKN